MTDRIDSQEHRDFIAATREKAKETEAKLDGINSSIRFKVRQEWREEGSMNGWRDYPAGSYERWIAQQETQKILNEEMWSR